MNREETLKLWQRCQESCAHARAAAFSKGERGEVGPIGQDAGRDEWNRWANELLAERKQLEEAGEWVTQASKWLYKASADFSAIHFLPREFGYLDPNRAVGGDAIVRSESWVTRVEPLKIYKREVGEIQYEFLEVLSDGNRIEFSGFIFPSGVILDRAEFHGPAFFERAQFHNVAFFRTAKFYKEVRFTNARFHGSVLFANAKFLDRTSFQGVHFNKSAFFEGAEFLNEDMSDQIEKSISFHRALFKRIANFKDFRCYGDASFSQATFEDSATFEKARFGKLADFTATKATLAFNLSQVRFRQIPKFNQADFKQAPDLDGIDWPMPPFFAKGEAQSIRSTVNRLKQSFSSVLYFTCSVIIA